MTEAGRGQEEVADAWREEEEVADAGRKEKEVGKAERKGLEPLHGGINLIHRTLGGLMLPLREPAIWSPPPPPLPPTRPPLQLGGLQRFRGPHKASFSEQVPVCHMPLNFAAAGNNQIKLTVKQ